MKPLALGALVFARLVGAPEGAGAQAQIVLEPPATPPAQPPPPGMTHDELQRAELAWYARRSRNVLIGTSVATAVGAALVFPAEANQCTSPEVVEETEFRCTLGGIAMIAFGYPLLVGGILGMVSGAIMLGVSKSRLRRFDNRASRKTLRAVRWDPAGSRFVF